MSGLDVNVGDSAIAVFFCCTLINSDDNKRNSPVEYPFLTQGSVTEESPLVAFFEKSLQYLQMNLIRSIVVPGVDRKGEIVEKPERLAEAYELGRAVAITS